VLTVGPEDEDGLKLHPGRASPVIDALIGLAVAIGVEEGRPVGALFIVGDSAKVMVPAPTSPNLQATRRRAQMMNPEVAARAPSPCWMAPSSCAKTGGAGGRSLSPEEDLRVPLDLALHMAAAGVPATKALATSADPGTVRVFRQAGPYRFVARIRRA
jgi:hypothetical protein